MPAQAYTGGDGAFAARYASVYGFVYNRYFAPRSTASTLEPPPSIKRPGSPARKKYASS